MRLVYGCLVEFGEAWVAVEKYGELGHKLVLSRVCRVWPLVENGRIAASWWGKVVCGAPVASRRRLGLLPESPV